MTSALARHDLPALLATTGDMRVDPRLSRDFVALLAAVGASPAGTSYDAVCELLEAGQTALEWLELDLEARVRILPPEAPAQQGAWLRDVELVALAHVGAQRLGPVVRPDLAQSLAAEAVRLALVHAGAPPRAWDCELVADASKGELPACAPWTWIASRTARGLLVPDDIDRTALTAWLEHRIHAEDAATLRRLVRESSAWRDAYRKALRVEHESVHPPRLDARQTVTTAHTVEELDAALCLMSIDLPHLGDAVTYEARLGASGIWWRWLGVDRPTTQTTDDAAVHEWGDEILGRCLVAIVPQPSTELAIAEDVARSADALASGLAHPRTGEIALEVADDFARGRLRSALERAAAAFASGADEAHDESRWTKAALSIRLSMADIAARLAREDVDEAFDRADVCLRHVGDALLLLSDDEYRDWTDGSFIDPDRWWGARERLLHAPTNAELTHSLDALRRRREAEARAPGNIVYPVFGGTSRARDAQMPAQRWLAAAASHGADAALDELALVPSDDDARFERCFRVAYLAVLGLPCAWLDQTLQAVLTRVQIQHPGRVAQLEVLHSALRPIIGTVPVALVDTRSGEGFLIALTVRVGRAPRDERIKALAWEAMSRAYDAVTRLSPTRLPRDAWDDLTFDLVGLPEDAEIDGSSLALPLAIAIASLWLGRPVPADLVATGNVHGTDDAAIGMVGGVLAKVNAVASAAAGTRVRMLVPSAAVVVTDVQSVELQGVESLAVALRVAGLSLDDAGYTPRWPDQSSLQKQLRDDIERVEQHQLGDLGEIGDPWRTLAIRLRLAADAMPADARTETLVAKARVYASLAFQHAGQADDAIAMLRDAADIELPPRLAAVRSIVELCAAIDSEDWPRCMTASARLEFELGSCSVQDREEIQGIARGTRGRALLHQRQDDDAVNLLREAVGWHERHLRHETARSRIYLAQALRQGGLPADALEQLGIAGRELNDMRAFSRPYADATEVFLRYERARVLAALSRFLEARQEAIEAKNRTLTTDFWPRLGILRVLAWATAALGDQAAHEDTVDEMRGLRVPAAYESLRDRLVAIAVAGPDGDDEVY